MFNKRTAFQLFFPEPLDSQDYQNLRISELKRIQMYYISALNLPRQLETLASMGVRVTLRLEEPFMVPLEGSYYDPLAWPSIRAGVQHVKQRVEVEAVIVGNEPQHGYNLTWSSRNWGNLPDEMFPSEGGRASAHARGVAGIVGALRGVCKVVSPGWEHNWKTPHSSPEDPRNAPEPGRMTWRELCLPAYNACDGNGAHVYALNYVSHEDENRYLWALGREVERCHRAVWLNETQVGARGLADVQRMDAVTRMGDLIAEQIWGGRVVSFCFFCSNGRADEEWSHMRVRDPKAYELLGNWLWR